MRDMAGQWELNLLAIFVFAVNPKIAAPRMRLLFFEATLTE